METHLAATDSQGFVDKSISRLRTELVERYSIECEFLGVPVLAQILGIGETTLYDYIRHGRFAVPHRMFNKTPKVRVDDLAEWMASGDNILKERPAFPPTRHRAVAAPPRLGDSATSTKQGD